MDAAAPRFDPDGHFLGFIGSVFDIDERKRSEESLALQNRRLEMLARLAGWLIVEASPEKRIQSAFHAVAEEVGADYYFDYLIDVDDPSIMLLESSNGLTSKQEAKFARIAVGEYLCGRIADTARPIIIDDVDESDDPACVGIIGLEGKSYAGFPLVSAGRLIGTVSFTSKSRNAFNEDHVGLMRTVADLSAAALDRSRVVAALQESEGQFRSLAENVSQLAWMAEPDGSIFWYNKRWYDYTGTDLAAMRDWGWREVHHPDHLDRVIIEVTANWATGQTWEGTYLLKSGSGEYRPFLTRAEPIRDADGTLIRWFGTNTDISAQLAAEDKELLAVVEADGTFAEVNAAWTELLGWESSELLGQPFASFTHPDDLEATQAKFAATFETPLTVPYEYRFRSKDGGYRWFSWTATFEQGRVYASGRDVNLEKERSVELEETQEALRQSQKMETLGQLTGGIAHDFNNLLQIISGNLDILRRTIPKESPRLERTVENAMRGAERAAILTQRLLAFSRRQPLAPKVIDPNKLVSGMSEMLHRTLGETVALESVLGSGLWRVEADPNQLETALLNLAVNARDAMPDGGKLTIETNNTHLDQQYSDRHSGVFSGQYVVLCVSDTGGGMDEATIDRAIEPFFTTKDVGKGTGLGLSMVYGFVKQSGGHFKIYSEAGLGTTIKIYLPRHHGTETVVDALDAERTPERADNETILVCEDDDDVRAFSAETLRELGYRVIEARDGEHALDLLAPGHEPVDLLFTDVVLPGITGAVLAERARELRPNLKVLFTTGYARNAIVHQGRLDPGVELLSKPFSYADLAARIRDLLDKR